MNSAGANSASGAYKKCTTARSLLQKTGLQNLLDRDGVTEIAINRPNQVLIETSDGWQMINEPRCDLETLMQLANAVCILNGGNHINVQAPIQSVTFPDGQRGQIVIPPACSPGTISLTIRRPSSSRFTIDDYVNSGRLSNFRDASEFLEVPDDVVLQDFELQMMKCKAEQNMGDFFRLAVSSKRNIVFVGGTGSGKTTVTKAVADLVSPETRIFTIEDTHELDLPHHPNSVHLFYSKSVTPKQVVHSCMRMKPDRVFLTELRGDEAYDYISLLNTGHPGSITTVHANDCRSALYRIGSLIKQSSVGITLDFDYIMREVMTTIDVVAFFEKTRLTQIYYDPVRKFLTQRGK